MFGKLKEKLKNWVTKTEKEEGIEKETKNDEKNKKKDQKKDKKTLHKKVDKEKKEKNTQKTKEKKKEEKKPAKIEEHKKETKKEIITEVQEEATKEAEEIKEEKETKKGLFGLFKKKEKIEEATEEKKDKEEEVEEKKSFGLFKKALTQEKYEELFEELQLILLQNNVAFEAVDAIKENLQEQLVGKTLSNVDLAKELEKAIEKLLINPPNIIEEIKKGLQEKKPYVILFCGINGSGKTTTIAKMTDYLKKQGFSVCLAAADTFRAASIEQIGQHAEKLNVPLIKKDYGSDPASVGFDAVNYAKKHHVDIVLIDTAGRMQNKDSLMKEMEKINRVNKPDMKIFLGESITGNDATEQAKAFNEAINLTGIILSKADVDEKGGTAISVSQVTGKPILFLGTGQEYKDLEIFDKEKMIKKLGLS